MVLFHYMFREPTKVDSKSPMFVDHLMLLVEESHFVRPCGLCSGTCAIDQTAMSSSPMHVTS